MDFILIIFSYINIFLACRRRRCKILYDNLFTDLNDFDLEDYSVRAA